MRRKVPFLGEEHIARAGDGLADVKKARGRIIDDVLNINSDTSSWDDVVVDKSASRSIEPPTHIRPHAAIAKPTKRGVVPFSTGVAFKKGVLNTSIRATIDWILINNGHGLRINVHGSMDQNIREEWRRLLEEIADNNVGQFEFNLTQAPTISLTGLGMLLLFKEQKGSRRDDIKLCHCNKDVWQLLQWTGMDKYFVIQAGSNYS